MNKLNQYKHNLAGKEIVYDNGNWSVNGRWHRKVYTVQADGSIKHTKTQHYWNNVKGAEEPHSGDKFVPDCDGKSIFVGERECKLPLGAEFELLPEHTCKAPCFHEYSYQVEGDETVHSQRFAFCKPTEANKKWSEFVSSFPQYAFSLLSVTRTA